jgi:hypothetical protein
MKPSFRNVFAFEEESPEWQAALSRFPNIHTCKHIYTHITHITHIHTHIHTYTHTQTHMHIHTHIHTLSRFPNRVPRFERKEDAISFTKQHCRVGTHTHIHTYTYTHLHTYTHTPIHTYTHTYLHTYTLTHIHTHTQVGSNPDTPHLLHSVTTLISWDQISQVHTIVYTNSFLGPVVYTI